MANATAAQGIPGGGQVGGQVGRSVPRLEAREKVTGRAEYTHNLRLPGMLYGKVFRSTVAHGRIKSIDVSAARAVPGVHRVVTSEDVLKVIPHPYYGPAFHDQPILAIGKVHYVGEPVAVVLADDPHVADAAADEAETMSDVRGSAPYKRELIRVYVRRAVRQAFEVSGAGTEGAAH